MLSLYIPGQSVELKPGELDGQWFGSIRIHSPDFTTINDFAVEVYAADSTDKVVQQLIDELHVFNERGGPLHTIEVEGREAYLVVVPRA